MVQVQMKKEETIKIEETRKMILIQIIKEEDPMTQM
jgi:hypothetical protein